MFKTSKKALTLLLLGGLAGVTSCDNQLSDIQSSLDGNHQNLNLENWTDAKDYNHQSDSLALVALYRATNGDAWSRHDNWLRDGKAISTWYGVQTELVDGKERVTGVRLGGNKLSGELPKEIGYLTALKSLMLSDNYKLGGTIPEELYNLKDLKVWKMRFTDMHGTLSSKIGNLTAIDTLDLWGAPWDLTQNGFIPKDEKSLLSGEIPAEIGNLTQARYIVLGRNKFTGNIPSEIGNLANLRYLDIARCKLSGALPTSFGQLKKLETLFVAGNELSGNLPEEMGEMTELMELYANENQLTGTVPASFANLHKLLRLSLNDNQLSGQLPEVLTQITSLGLLYLENNQFEGEIPANLGGTQQPLLVSVYLSNNNLTGKLPEKVAHDYILDGKNYGKVYTTFYVDGNRLSGKIPAEYYMNGTLQEGVLPQQPGYELTK